ncbi:Zn(II)2Cys6 transcription factor [Phanerochaete sordida]|uniref:Zn(II)2Cys6 transcription factor n=1 Tax=Phanerochaete sordida TaxID=48140 RepID=A0A9P3G828_9APHY|nr:Zn(II)2Cys6 transcription factor [Phanerochaete sordida]
MSSKTAGGGSSREPASSGKGAKKKRTPRTRACDQCRRRKGDAAEVDGPRCSSCIAFDFQCTYLAGTDKRFTDVDYVKTLEKELGEMRELCLKQQSLLNAHGIPTDQLEPTSPMSGQSTPVPTPSTVVSPEPEALDVDEPNDATQDLIDSFRALNLHRHDVHHIGHSSNLTLIRTAIDVKQDYVSQKNATPTALMPLTSRRPEFWIRPSVLPPQPPYTDFPDPVLMDSLVAQYFEIKQPMSPLLHRPTFEAGISSGQHLREEGFGATVLLVCALGAKYLEKPQGLPLGEDGWHWAGWRWFEQVQSRRRLLPLTGPSLYDLQVAYLAAAYIGGSIVPNTNVALIAHALRLALDMGLHRRRTYGSTPTVDGELKKRAFWNLLLTERGMCMVHGRPCSLQDDDFDVDYPIECDDEYWINDDPELAFKQPEGKPSVISYFISTLRQGRLVSAMFRTLYTLRAHRLLAEPERARLIVSELDSELNKWLESIPPHLKWDNEPSDKTFAGQSAALLASAYMLRIMIHRPFLSPRKLTAPPFPSFTICTNAARAAVQVLERHYRRFGADRVLPGAQLVLLTAALILMMNVWGGKQTGSAMDTARDMEEVDKVMDMYKALEHRYNSAGRLWDILHDLKTVVGDPVQPQTHKRRRDDDDAAADEASEDSAADAELPRKRLQQRPTPPPPPSAARAADAGDAAGAAGAADVDFSAFWQTLGVGADAGGQPMLAPGLPGAGGVPADADFEAFFAGFLPAPSAFEVPYGAPVHGDVQAAAYDAGAAGVAGVQPPSDAFMTPGAAGQQQPLISPFGEAPSLVWDAEQGYAAWGMDAFLTNAENADFNARSHWPGGSSN